MVAEQLEGEVKRHHLTPHEKTSFAPQFLQADLTALTFGQTNSPKGQNLQSYHGLLAAVCTRSLRLRLLRPVKNGLAGRRASSPLKVTWTSCGLHSTASLLRWKRRKRMWACDVCMGAWKRKKKTDIPVRDEMRSSPGTGQSQYAELDWVLREDRPPAQLIQTETARMEEGTELLFVCECVCVSEGDRKLKRWFCLPPIHFQQLSVCIKLAT